MVRVIVHGGGTDANTPRGAGVERGGRKGKRRLSVGSVERRQTEATFFFAADGTAEERRSRFCGGSAATKKKWLEGRRRAELPQRPAFYLFLRSARSLPPSAYLHRFQLRALYP